MNKHLLTLALPLISFLFLCLHLSTLCYRLIELCTRTQVDVFYPTIQDSLGIHAYLDVITLPACQAGLLEHVSRRAQLIVSTTAFAAAVERRTRS
jgi:hypothetical protein